MIETSIGLPFVPCAIRGDSIEGGFLIFIKLESPPQRDGGYKNINVSFIYFGIFKLLYLIYFEGLF